VNSIIVAGITIVLAVLSLVVTVTVPEIRDLLGLGRGGSTPVLEHEKLLYDESMRKLDGERQKFDASGRNLDRSR